jgi:catechol 2,3-dioxygenase-like lactoylglutathione lyase family enzyme
MIGALDRVAVRHIALVVPTLREAEAYYRDVFRMELIGREAAGPGGEAHGLPLSKDWTDAEAAGIDVAFVALRRDELVLALARGDVSPGQVLAIGLVMPAQEIAAVAARLPDQAGVTGDGVTYLEFLDPFGLRWQLGTDRAFQTAGEITGRWLSL